jgi:hypothetical protein
MQSPQVGSWWANELSDEAIPATFERPGLSLSSAAMSERYAARTGALAVTAAAIVLPIFMPVPRELPATAMGSALLLYFERGLAVLAILLFLLVFLYRSLVYGELPKAISGRGAEWTELTTKTASATDFVQDQIDALRTELEGLKHEIRTGGTLRQ